MCDWLNKTFPTFQLFYMTLAINRIDGRGLGNTACCECLGNVVLVTEGLPDGSNNAEHLSYKGE